jgi:hypothetical protein
MDQLKDILKQMIKHRFWIAVGISVLLPVIAYAVGSGPIKAKAKAQAESIKGAYDGVSKYKSGTVPNVQYKPLVDERTGELVKDVNASWKKLYARQAPLLTWPSAVQERFQTWERKWPENVDPSAVQLAIIEYVTAYPKFVTEVYQTFRPFDLMEGTGVVSAPAEEVLLHPFPFTIENPPELGKVWAAQERLWTQRTLLEVIAQVNKDAKEWNTATIKQINLLEVGNSASQDQKSIAKGETLNEAPAITNPAAPAAAATTGTDPAAPGGAGAGQPMMVMQATDSVYYIKNDSTQFKVLPFQMSVLIEQDHVQDLLVALENSPMAIQVMEFEMSKPLARIVKPVKGQNMLYGEYSGMQQMMPGASGVTLFRSYSMPMMMPGGGGMPGAARGGVDRRGEMKRSEKEKKVVEALKKATAVTIHDPYFNIVEMTVYGQTRFYNPPPPEPPAQPSVAAESPPTAPEAATPPATEAAAPKAEGEAPKAEGEAPKAEAPKEAAPGAEAPKAETEAPKAETPKEAAPAPGGETPKAEPGPVPAPK